MQRLFRIILIAAFALGIGYQSLVRGSAEAAKEVRDAFGFSFDNISGGSLDLSSYRGKVLLVVNTASFCGFTKQYEGLQALWERYEEAGLVVIGVPSNDFGGQEPKGESDILGFCQGAFGVTFPLTTKTVVKGNGAHPFYKWAADVVGRQKSPQWNFHKYLVGRDGRLVGSFASGVAPQSKEMLRAIDDALKNDVS